VSVGSAEDELVEIICSNTLQHVIHTDADGTLECLFWSSSKQLELLASHGEVIMLDATYKVNNLRMPLYTLAVVDKDGHGQPVAHAVLAREDEAHVRLFLADVLQWEDKIAHATFVTDKDFAEINAVRSVCPQANVFLCRFHIMKAFTEEINRQAVNDGEVLLTVSYCVLQLHTDTHRHTDTLIYCSSRSCSGLPG